MRGFLDRLLENLFGSQTIILEPGKQPITKQDKPSIVQRMRGKWGDHPPEKKEVSISPPPTVAPSPTTTPTTTPTPPPSPKLASSGYTAPQYGRIGATESVSPDVYDIVQQASNQYGVPMELLLDIAFSESSLNPNLVGPTQDVGLFQFTPSTWSTLNTYAQNPKSTLTNFDPELGARFDPLTNAMAAAYLISKGQLGRWDASKFNWGAHYEPEEIEQYYSQTLGR